MGGWFRGVDCCRGRSPNRRRYDYKNKDRGSSRILQSTEEIVSKIRHDDLDRPREGGLLHEYTNKLIVEMERHKHSNGVS